MVSCELSMMPGFTLWWLGPPDDGMNPHQICDEFIALLATQVKTQIIDELEKQLMLATVEEEAVEMPQLVLSPRGKGVL